MILTAVPDHAGVLAALHETSFASPWRPDEFQALLRQPGVAAWICMREDAPVGFILVRAVADEAEILTLAVLPDARRKGIGARLLQHAVEILRGGGTERLFLEVAADNAAALALYARDGFMTTGKRAAYYAGRVDALTMTRAI